MLIDDYFNEFEKALSVSPYVHHYEISKDKRSLYIGFLEGIIRFVGGTELHFMEFVNCEDEVERYKYSYHYQKADGKPIFRYDMAPHHPEITTKPHHKHLFSENAEKVSDSNVPSIIEVIREIERFF